MNIKTFVAVTMTSVVSFFSFADQGDVLITFSSPGPDKYADGSTVKDGEWYAVCWSADGQFDGLTTACQPVTAGEELILAAPLAKGGRCPFVAFEFARNDKYASGKFSVLMLDTRSAGGQPAARGANGLPVFVNGAAVAAAATKGSAMSVEASTSTSVAGDAFAQTRLQDGVTPAKITAIEVVGANIQLTVEDLTGPCVIKTGDAPDKLDSFVLPTASGEGATFILPKEKGKYFSAVSLPQ